MIISASKRHARRKDCGNKVKYATIKEAQDALYHIRSSGGDHNMHTYKCPYCHYYHIGHHAPEGKNERNSLYP